MSTKTATLANRGSANAGSEPRAVAATRPGEHAPGRKSAPEEAIRLRAYQKWEVAGKPPGDGIQFWLDAENELMPSK